MIPTVHASINSQSYSVVSQSYRDSCFFLVDCRVVISSVHNPDQGPSELRRREDTEQHVWSKDCSEFFTPTGLSIVVVFQCPFQIMDLCSCDVFVCVCVCVCVWLFNGSGEVMNTKP